MCDQNLDLIQNGIDIAIRIGKLKDSTYIAKLLSVNKRLLCASPEYLKKFGIPQTLDDLKKHRCILQQHEKGLTDSWRFLAENGEIQHIKLNGYFVSNSGDAIREASLNSLGISNHSI